MQPLSGGVHASDLDPLGTYPSRCREAVTERTLNPSGLAGREELSVRRAPLLSVLAVAVAVVVVALFASRNDDGDPRLESAEVAQAIDLRLGELIAERGLRLTIHQCEFQGDVFVIQTSDPLAPFLADDEAAKAEEDDLADFETLVADAQARLSEGPTAAELEDAVIYAPLRLYRDAVRPYFRQLRVGRFILSVRDEDQTVTEISRAQMAAYLAGELDDREFADQILTTGLR